MPVQKKEFVDSYRGQDIKVVFQKRIRQRNLIIKIKNKQVIVSAPFYVSYRKMELFLNDNKDQVFSKVVDSSSAEFDNNHFKINQKFAVQKLQPLVEKWINITGLKPAKIVIRNQSSRWGSASTKKTISLNYRLAFLPEYLAEYVIIHELCHLQEMNHSQRFWKLVKEFCPDYKKAIKEIRILSKNYF